MASNADEVSIHPGLRELDSESLMFTFNEDALKKQLDEIVSHVEISCKNVHEKATAYSNADLHTFYQYFVTKYVAILQRQAEGPKRNILEKHSSIFPFKTNANLPISLSPVCEFFDEKFLTEIRTFVRYHFGHEFDLEQLKNLFLTNIEHFKRQHFKNSPSLKQLTRIIGTGSTWRGDSPPEHLSDYLADFIRLNDDGVEWYQFFQAKFNQLCKIYNKGSWMLPEKSASHFKYLPEINCCELLLLLQPDYFHTNRSHYTSLFRKYLFFFANAIRQGEFHAVYFIDECLFYSLLFKKRYYSFQGDIMNLQWELWMMTLVHRRRFPLPYRKQMNFQLDEQNLRLVVEHIQKIPGIQKGILNYSEPRYPRLKIFLLLDDVIFTTGYSSLGNNYRGSLVILISALLDRDVKRIVNYNPCMGQETSFEISLKKHEILDFVREHVKPIPMYPERFLIRGLSQYFVNIPAAALQH